MSEIGNFRFDDPSTQFAKGYDQVNLLRQNQATIAAGQQLQNGNYQGAAGDLYGAGMLSQGGAVQATGEARQAAVAQKQKDQQADLLKFTADAADRLQQIAQSTAGPDRVNKVLAGFDQLAPVFKQHGETDADLAEVRQHLMADPDTTLAALGAGARKLQVVHSEDGEVGFADPVAGTYKVAQAGHPKPFEMDPTKNYYMRDSADASGGAPASATPASAAGQISPDAVWRSIKTQESGGQASPGTAVGPDTPSGNAYGSTQMLPATAEAMARKIGVSWNPALMRENSPRALAYQDRLGRAYFDEGLEKSGGDPAAAAAYYFAGPDPAQHGPKTRQYVNDVMNRAGGVQPYQVAANGATPAPPTVAGYHLVQAAQPKDDGEGAELTPDAIHLLAGRYLKDGTLPPLGMGKTAAAARQKILNEATGMAKTLGIDAGDLVAGTVSVKAAGQALSRATTMRSQVEGFEQTASKNADLMLSLAPKGGGQTNIPVANRWLQAGRKQIAGDPDVTSFDIALGTFADEYAKIVSGSTGGQGSTDASRKEAYDRLSKYASQGQLQSGISTMKQEMSNRISSLHEVEVGLRTQIRGGGSEPDATPPASGQRLSPADAAKLPPGTHFIGLDGVQRVRH